ncbi:MAG TPA: hypothetical protein IAA76_03345 [Candidatus Ornithospirochaeta stercorigallinarum]|nr:hypothetical protein [Candidatus Ornithospirochaeta stercorigallinarum]
MGGIVAADVQFKAEETLLENRQGVICTLCSMKRLSHADVIKTIQSIPPELSAEAI